MALLIDTIEGPKCAQCHPQSHRCKPTGWAAVERALAHYDKLEIGSYKEDIDTLLVFTGLYSAILAAFVVVSYTQLQEDTAAESLKVLRIIAYQNAGRIEGGGNTLNSTSIPALSLSLPSSFQPSAAAVRINVLWFASLVVSLSTASFAMLMKQWLREYLAFASSSPRSQLRVREFRRAGLKTWGVFALASTLPLLLQLSLALFFIGLCIFTINVHPAVANTTLPLICAWAFLLISFTLSPVFSSQCPYKTPALASLTAWLRKRVWRPMADNMAPRALRAIYYTGRFVFYSLVILLTTPILMAEVVLRALLLGRSISNEGFATLFNSIHDKLWNLHYESLEPSREEGEILSDTSLDLIILASADTFQANSELDLTTIREAFEQSRPTWDAVVRFLVQVIGNRTPLPAPFAEGPRGALLDLGPLSSSAKAAIATVFDTYVVRKLPEDPQDFLSLSDSTVTAGAWAVHILLSLGSSDIPTGILTATFDQWCSRIITMPSCPARTCAILPMILLRVIRDSKNTCQTEVLDLVHGTFDVYTPSTADLQNRFDSSLPVLLNDAAHRLNRDLKAGWRTIGDPNDSDPSVYYRTISLLFKMCGTATLFGHRMDYNALLGARIDRLLPLQQMLGMREVMVSWTTQPFDFISDDTPFLIHILMQRSTTTDRAFLVAVIRDIARLAAMENRATTQLLNLSLISLRLMKADVPGLPQPFPATVEESESSTFSQHTEVESLRQASTTSPPSLSQKSRSPCCDSPWRHIFLYLASAMRTNGPFLAGDGNVNAIAEACWKEVDCVPPLMPPQPLVDFDEVGSAIPDYFCIALSRYYSPSGGRRAQRIREMADECHRRIRHDGEHEIGRKAFG